MKIARPFFGVTFIIAAAASAAAQVPGAPMGPPRDNYTAPGADGPTIACRLFSYGCHVQPPAPEPAVSADTPPAAAPAHAKKKKRPAKAAKAAKATPQT